MTLEEFYKEEQGRLLAFRMRWMEAHHKSPDQYPLELPAGDWDDQYLSFDPNEKFEIVEEDDMETPLK